MASRLSEESLRAAYDAGHQSFTLAPFGSEELLYQAPASLNSLLELENAKARIQAIKPQTLYAAILNQGPEDSLDVLKLISRSQFVKIYDYDVWNYDRLAPAKAFRWLELYKNLGRKELIKRFRQLDEEYQIALLGPLVRTYDLEAYEEMSDVEQDRMNALPCNEMFYEIKSDDKQTIEIIEEVVAAALQEDIQYCYSLLAHAGYMPPNEEEAKIAQFRRARLEEDGFVTYEESLAMFRPVDVVSIRKESGLTENIDALVTHDNPENKPFLGLVLAKGDWTDDERSELTQGFAFLSNSLCSASRVEPDDQSGLKLIMHQVHAISSLGLEYLAGGDIQVGKGLLLRTHIQILFRTGITIIGRLQEAMVERLQAAELPDTENLGSLLRMDKRGEILRKCDVSLLPILGHLNTEIIKGLFNRYPVSPKQIPTGDAEGGRIIFSPIDTLANLQRFGDILDGLAGLLHLYRLAEGDGDIDQSLHTAFANVLLGNAFTARRLSREEVDQVVGLDNQVVQTMTSDFMGDLESNLTNSLKDAADQTWSVTRNANMAAGNPVQSVMSQFSDTLMRFHLQRELESRKAVSQFASLLLVNERDS